jgi:multidrug efflux system outer membrane protein
MFHSRSRRIAAIGVACLLVAGCAVEPQPLSQEERDRRTVSDLRLLREIEYVPTSPITLNEAIARAVSFNLERRVKEIEREISEAELETKNYDMLPALEIDAARNKTSNKLTSTDDPLVRTASAGVTWNVLDLGVSYARAKQTADKTLIARENERKALQDIARNVRTAYWRAFGAQRLMDQVGTLSKNIQVAMRESREMERTGANDVAKSVAYRREIVESVREALTIQRELREARGELSKLLNIRPGVDFDLAGVSLDANMPALPMSLPEMETQAIENRPEIRVEDYNERISEWQAREALFDMLPGLKLSAAKNYSSDVFNLTPNWISTGFQLGMNIFDLFSGSSRMEEADRRGELARSQRLALTLAVMTQTHMAYIRFRNATQQMRLAREVARADRRLALLVASDTDFANTDYLEAVQVATRRLRSEADEHRARVELIAAHSDLMHSIGLDAFPPDLRVRSIAELTAEVAKVTARWEVSGKDLSAPADTPLDALIDAMLRGGEGTPVPGRGGPDIREARALVPPPALAEDVPPGLPSTAEGTPLAKVATASGESGTAVPLLEERRPDTPMIAFDGSPSPSGESVAADAPPAAEIPVDVWPEEPEAPAEALAADVGGAQETEPEPQPQQAAAHFHVVQLGVFSTEARAERLRKRLTAAPESALHGVDVRIVQRPANSGETLHYVETGAIAEPQTARALCATLKGLGQDCVPVSY